ANAKIVLEKQAQLQIMVHGAATLIAAADEERSVQDVMDEVFEELSKKLLQQESSVSFTVQVLEEVVNNAAKTVYRDETLKHDAIAQKANQVVQKVMLLVDETLVNIQNASANSVLEVFNTGIKTINSELATEIQASFDDEYENNENDNTQNNPDDTNQTLPVENNETNSSNEENQTVILPVELQSYYTDALDKNGSSLKSALHSIVTNSAVYVTYAQAYEYLAVTDMDESVASGDNLILFYMQSSFLSELRCGSSATGCWNREHMWPKSLGVGYNESVNTYTDLHHLRPTDAGINSSRGNTPYGDATTPYSKIDGFYYDDKFEVSDTLKGEVARAILYMTVRYEGDNGEPDLEIYAGDFTDSYPAELCTMYRWHYLDPVSESEKKRNDLVQSYQGNRNPFVDNPEWVESIWGNECEFVEGIANDNNNSDENTSVDDANQSVIASELIISEYVEGSSYNKALELYNAGSQSISLGEYKVELYSNGSLSATNSVTLNSVTLTPGETYVISNNSSNENLLSVSDQTSGAINHNGDDAYALVHIATDTKVDVFGRIGEDPGDFWGTDLVTTKDHTLRRKSSIASGDTISDDTFNPSVEWEAYEQDLFDGLGVR
ncbi:MAG: endonuclease, partial [Campylobacterales bacterium]|nr:endonuclease [Campylobacterales bacterium]